MKFSLETLETRQLLAAFGQLDQTFGTDGHAQIAISGSTVTPVIDELQLLTSGKIVAVGPGAIARFNSDGTVDTAFGTSGKTLLPASVTFRAAAVNTANNSTYVLVSGTAGSIVLRYTASGKLDTTWGSSGTALVSSNSNFSPQAIAVQADGKVIVAGVVVTDDGNGAKARAYRLTTSGTGDTSFGTSASVDFQLGTTNLLTPVLKDSVAGIAVLSSGKILIGGGSLAYSPEAYDPNTGDYTPASYGDTMFAVARLTSAGALDSTYGASGVSRSAFATGINGQLPTAFAAKDDGTSAVASAVDQVVIAQFSASGGVDFNKQADPGYEFNTAPEDMTVKGDGRWCLVGNPSVGLSTLALAEVDSAGVFSNVIWTTDLDKDTVDLAESDSGAITVAADGDLLVGGQPGDFSSGFEIAKFDAGAAGAARPDEFLNAQNNDIVRDSAGGLHLAYFDAVAKVLKYAYRAPNGLWSAPEVVDSTANAGYYLSIDTDSKNRPGIQYFDGTNGDARFAFKASTTWSTEAVETTGSVGLYPSLMFDNSDRPTVTYYVKGKGTTKIGDLRFAVKSAGVWKFETVQSADDVGRSGDLDVDPVTGRFAVAYVDTTVGQVNYALHQKGGTWAISKAATTKGGADYLSLDFTYYGQKPAISYYDAFAADLKLTSFSGSSWTSKILASKNAVGQFSYVQYDPNGGAIYAWNRTSDSIILTRDDFATPQSETIVTGGGRYLSVDSDGTEADFAYYDAANTKLKVRGAPIHLSTVIS